MESITAKAEAEAKAMDAALLASTNFRFERDRHGRLTARTIDKLEAETPGAESEEAPADNDRLH